jgi:predicted ATP-grasp superfamily ATP-dependent carboligase
MKAIILDGHLKSSLSTVRSLGEKGVEFSVGSVRSTAMALHSTYTKDKFIYPSPEISKEKFVDAVIAEAERIGDKPLIYAFSDAVFLSLLRHRIRIEKVATLVMGESQFIEIAFNKRKTTELARELDIRIPVTNALDDLDDIAVLSKKLAFPAIVKPQHSFEWKEGKGYKGTVKSVCSPGELTAYVAEIYTETNEMPLIQSRIRGPEYGAEVLCNKGEVVAHFIHRRVRSLSPEGGASVVKESAQLDGYTREMLASAKKFGRALKWHGVMMVEFKVNENSGKVFLIEINGRFWGSLPLAIHSGVDFPSLYFDLANKKEIAEVTKYETVCSRHFLGDVKYLLSVLFKSRSGKRINYPTRGAALSNFFRERNYKYDVLHSKDLTPFFMEIVDYIAKSLKLL